MKPWPKVRLGEGLTPTQRGDPLQTDSGFLTKSASQQDLRPVPLAARPELVLSPAWIFHTPMETPTVRRVRARGLQARTSAPVGRVPYAAFGGVKYPG